MFFFKENFFFFFFYSNPHYHPWEQFHYYFHSVVESCHSYDNTWKGLLLNAFGFPYDYVMESRVLVSLSSALKNHCLLLFLLRIVNLLFLYLCHEVHTIWSFIFDEKGLQDLSKDLCSLFSDWRINNCNWEPAGRDQETDRGSGTED